MSYHVDEQGKPVGLVKVVPKPTEVSIAGAGAVADMLVLFEDAVAGGQYLDIN